MKTRIHTINHILPHEPEVYISWQERELLSPFWALGAENHWFVNFIKSSLILLSFQWTSWGNNSKDIKSQSIQEVTNFGILSALTLALNISIVATVDGNPDWEHDSTWRQALGVIFNVASSCLIISLLSSAILLLFINETPEGRAVYLVIEGIGGWMRLPGFSFMVGVYGYCALICCWLMHTFYVWLSVAVCGLFVFIASGTLFGTVSQGVISMYRVMSSYGIVSILSDKAIDSLLQLYLKDTKKLRENNAIVGYKRDEFYDWILKQYDCCEFCDLSHRRLNRYLDKWEEKDDKDDK